jgi:hypothetical protein
VEEGNIQEDFPRVGEGMAAGGNASQGRFNMLGAYL